MASSARVFNQTFRCARNLKHGSAKIQKLTSSLHVTNMVTSVTNCTSKTFSQLTRPAASLCGLVHGQAKFNSKTKMQFGPQPETCSNLIRSACFFSPVMEGSEDSTASCSEGGDSSCEAMEGPHGDDDGLVIHWSSLEEDL